MIRTRIVPALAALLLTVAAQAADEVTPAPALVTPIAETDSVAAIFAATTPVPSAELDELTGKAQLQVDKIQVNDQELTGVVTDNVAINTQNGNNVVSDGAYTNAAGFMTTIQNTGNNVLIQNATIINLTVEP